ncbi:MAG TPA: alpha/beta fold hydrolase [Geminicoccus sp.]|uniref:alpha/beta fold hydrolase n=1 Tax=Geminicoccus sp. TaxID=2024832 RepID=UPI002E2FF49F|nr:alpha/beta fold hydrolase [Geminicoccus sp.]HEX2528061.1 alpha/beta fold hydrolase [Geminicoccus sp.]
MAYVLLILLLGACHGAAPPPARTPGPLPEITFDPPGKPKVTIIALHGFNDRKAAFDEVGAWLAARGYRLVAYDQAGYGARQDRGIWPSTDQLVRDLLFRVRVERAGAPDVPVWILGESMGGAVALVAAARLPDELDVEGLILSAPGVWGGDAVKPYVRRPLRALAAVAPDMVFTGGDLGILASDNIPMLIELGKDPLYLRTARADSLIGIFDLMDEAVRDGPSVRLPVTILNGDVDQVILPEIQKEFVASMPSDTCREIRYPGGWHMLLRDLGRETVFKDVLAVLEGQRPGQPCGPRAAGPPPRS